MKEEHIYRITFHNQGNIYELYARYIDTDNMYAFIEVGDFIFGERSSVVVDPSEEQLKQEFSGVKRTYIPMHAVVRIDEVEKSGTNKIIAEGEKGGKVTNFPIPLTPPKGRND
jgi:hypothetical protein